MEQLKERVLDYLTVYPSVGVIRLARDLKVPLNILVEAIRELEREGLVEYLDKIGVVNFIPWKEGFVEAGYKLKESEVPERRKKGEVTLLDFV